MDVGHLARDADLVVVEIGDVLFAVFGVVKDLRQRFVAVLVGVDIGVAAFVGVLLQQAAAVPDEVGAFRFGTRPGEFVLAFFGKPSAERVVGICPDFGIAGGLFDFGADELVFYIVLVIMVFTVGQLAVDLVAMSIWHRIFQANQSWLVVPCYLIYNHEEECHYQPTTSRYGQSIPKKR